MIEINRILCPIDFSEYSDHALRYAMKLASWYRARLHVLHVMPPMQPSSTSELAAAGRRLVGAPRIRSRAMNTPDVDV
jgi:nucleotide-binding universal stress UspA family protein